MRDVSLSASIMGYNFTAPFFIAPAANAGLAHPLAELNLARAAGKAGILYAPSLLATKTIEEIAAVAAPGQIMFHQLYVSANKTKLVSDLRRIEAGGFKGIFVTIDGPIHGIRPREVRYGFSNTPNHDAGLTWEGFRDLQKMTKLPLIPKGIQTVEDARLAVEVGVEAIYVSSHGGRQLDTAQQPLETLLEILRYEPDIFKKVDVFADGGVRYGTDVLKLLAMGAKMVGVGRPPMFANVFGEEGVSALLEVLRREVWVDAANLGVQDVKKINPTYVSSPFTGWLRERGR
jgi:isopentenyl diphosphate isomerase/L-lactate dehydrogenase-like FMN-dependent dehydrogenase